MKKRSKIRRLAGWPAGLAGWPAIDILPHAVTCYAGRRIDLSLIEFLNLKRFGYLFDFVSCSGLLKLPNGSG